MASASTSSSSYGAILRDIYKDRVRASYGDGVILRWDPETFDWVVDEKKKEPEVTENEFGPVCP